MRVPDRRDFRGCSALLLPGCYPSSARLREYLRGSAHVLMAQSSVSLGRLDRRVPENLLKCGKVSGRLEEATCECVSALVNVEPIEIGQGSHSAIERP